MSTADDTALTDSRIARRGTALRGAAAGVAAWLLGYLVVYVSKADAVSESLRGVGFVSQLLGGEAIPAWKGVAWLFLNAHFAAVRFPTIAGGTRSLNFVTGEEGAVLLLAVPVLTLLGAGVAATYGRPGGAVERAKAGATAALGYLPLSAAAAVLSAHAVGDTGAAISPDSVTAVLLAGVVYPLVFGAVGGAASAALE